jgi:hypothetical protein
MSKTGVIVALVFAVVLAGAAFFVTNRKAPPVEQGPLLRFDPARTVEVRITAPDGAFQAIQRLPSSGEWDVVIAGPGGEVTGRWPAAPTQVRAALRILSTLEPMRSADPGAALGPDAHIVGVKQDNGVSSELQLAARGLAGSVLAKAGGRAGMVGADVAAMLIASGPREWRDRSVLPAFGPDVSRITVRGQSGTVALARVQGRWGLREPIQAPAEAESVGKLLAMLGNVNITDFLDRGPPPDTGLDSPVAELVIESDSRPEGGGPVTTLRRGLRVGRQADMGGKTVFVAIDRPGGEPRIVAVTAESLASIHTEPAFYVSRRSIEAPAVEVGRAAVVFGAAPYPGSDASIPELPVRGPLELTRGVSGWQTPSGAAALRADAEGVKALLDLLGSASAEAVLLEAPAHALRIGSVDLKTIGDTPLGTVEIGMVVEPVEGRARAGRVFTKIGPVFRVYSQESGQPVAAWLLSRS